MSSLVALGDVVDIASGQVDPREEPYCSWPHVGGDNIESDTGRLFGIRTAKELKLISGKYEFGIGDVLYSKIRPALNKVALPEFRGICSADMYPLRPRTDRLERRYLAYLLREEHFLAYAAKHSSRTNIPKINRDALLGYEFRLPALVEQQRIVAILDKADSIRGKRREGITLTQEMLRSTFLDMFGDPIANPRGWPMRRLGDLAEIVGGGTPSRATAEFYRGTIPWATAKDFKRDTMLDTEEHVSSEALDASAAKLVAPGTILVVVKSKILMRRLPVSIAGVPLCFNQDVKGIVANDASESAYLAAHLRMAQRSLLELARGVNTEGLTIQHLRTHAVMRPPRELIQRFTQLDARMREALAHQEEALVAAEHFFKSLVHRAFQDGFGGSSGLNPERYRQMERSS